MKEPDILHRLGIRLDPVRIREPKPPPWWRWRKKPDALLPYEHPIIREVEP